MIEVLEIDQNKIAGEVNGYKYQFIQSLDNKVCYLLTHPNGNIRIVTLTNQNEVAGLIQNPEAFWSIYVQK